VISAKVSLTTSVRTDERAEYGSAHFLNIVGGNMADGSESGLRLSTFTPEPGIGVTRALVTPEFRHLVFVVGILHQDRGARPR
jgi:hypothetical protein